MATNIQQPGVIVELTAPSGGVTSGVPVQIGQILVVPLATAAQTVKFSARVACVVSYTKVGSQAWTEGAIVYWDSGNARFTTVATGALRCGVAVVAVGSGAGETTGVVRLDGVARVQEST